MHGCDGQSPHLPVGCDHIRERGQLVLDLHQRLPLQQQTDTSRQAPRWLWGAVHWQWQAERPTFVFISPFAKEKTVPA